MRRVVDWAEVVRAVALDLSPLIAEAQLDFEIDTVPAPVRAHEWMLRELTRNLLHNAIKHSPAARPPAVRLACDASQAALTHRRQRPGHRAELRSRLFQPLPPATRAAAPAWGWPSATRSSLRWAADLARQPRGGGPHRWTRRDRRCCWRRMEPYPPNDDRPKPPTKPRMRLDKGLGRRDSTRRASLAVEEIEKGRMQVNGEAGEGSREPRDGDPLALRQASRRDHARPAVQGLSDDRGPAPAEQAAYDETPQSMAVREVEEQRRAFQAEPALAIEQGRPTKRDRRDSRSGSAGARPATEARRVTCATRRHRARPGRAARQQSTQYPS